MSEKALVAMSGGVDSSVAAALMCQSEYDCIGVTMKLHSESVPEREGSCCTLADTEDARSVSYKLGMKYYVFNFTDDFESTVIERFINAYENGETPNPCIDCNRFMKFEKLYDRAKILGCDKVATGHYARIEYDEKSKRYLLKKSKNEAKDQTYVLYFLSQEQLKHTVFPLGSFESKEDVRRVAEQYGFINASKKDSQDICFVPDGDYASFIERHTGKTFKKGNFVNLSGEVLGEHKGIIHYTVGQRKGLGIALGEPAYVREINAKNNEVVLCKNEELFTKELVAKDFNWIAFDAPQDEIRAAAKPRYRAKEAPCTAKVLENGNVKIAFDTPQRAVTKGQAVVLYDGDTVIGGGTICEV